MKWPNNALERTRPSHSGCNPRVPRAGSLSLNVRCFSVVHAICNLISTPQILACLALLVVLIPVMAAPEAHAWPFKSKLTEAELPKKSITV